MRSTMIAASVALTAAAGCHARPDATSGTGCAAYAVIGLTVVVRDSATGAAVPAAGTRVSARGKVYVLAAQPGHDAWEAADGTHFGLAEERPDTYTVRVERAGYRPWERAGVPVTADACHVRPTDLTALLQRSAEDVSKR